MRRSTALVVALAMATSLGACDVERDLGDWQSLREGLPDKESLELRVPDDSEEMTGGALASLEAALAAEGERSELYLGTYQMTASVNRGVMVVLTFLDAVLLYPPTRMDGNTAEWGPVPLEGGLSPFELLVSVTRHSSSVHEFMFKVRDRGSDGPWTPWYWGNNRPGGETARRGQGDFTIDFDAMSAHDPATSQRGRVEVTYDTRGPGRIISIDFLEFRDRPTDPPLTADYYFEEGGDLSGLFHFVTTGDVHAGQPGGEAYPAAETWTIHSVWEGTGPGRSDVHVTGGDLPDAGMGAVVLSECWDASFDTTFGHDSFLAPDGTEVYGETVGEATSCAFEAYDFE